MYLGLKAFSASFVIAIFGGLAALHGYFSGNDPMLYGSAVAIFLAFLATSFLLANEIRGSPLSLKLFLVSSLLFLLSVVAFAVNLTAGIYVTLLAFALAYLAGIILAYEVKEDPLLVGSITGYLTMVFYLVDFPYSLTIMGIFGLITLVLYPLGILLAERRLSV